RGAETRGALRGTYGRTHCTCVSAMSPSQHGLFAPLRASALAITVSVAGCAGNGAGLNSNGQPIGSGGSGATEPLIADFQSIQDHVFTPICSPCHSGASAPEGLMLDAAHSYNLLVSVPSNEVPALDRVKPADPDGSYIILKLQGSPGIVGSQMPLNETPLPQSTIDVIRQWITNGAPQGTSTASAVNAMQKRQGLDSSTPPAPFRVSYTSPVDEAVVDTPLTHVVVVFNHEVDASLINYTTLTVERIDPATARSSAEPGMGVPAVGTSAADFSGQPDLTAQMVHVPSYAAPAGGNSNVVVITPVAPLLPGTYRVTVRGSGGGALADLNAQALGSDYSFTFNVDGAP
ncbi:MAG: Ig-like domain-containing protein, partial [Steroidobacteraceae bacterium]